MTTIEKLIERVDPVPLDTELHACLKALKEHGAVPVVRGRDIAGMLFVSEISKREYPVNTKASSMLLKVPTLQANADIIEAAAALARGRNKALPVLEGTSYTGVLTEHGLLRHVADRTTGRRTEELMSEPITISNDATVGKARATMRDKGIGKLPVVNENGELVGVVDWSTFIAFERPKSALGRQDKKGDYLQDSKMTVTTIMDDKPLTVEREEDIAQVAKKMETKGCSYAIVTAQKLPVGIVTCEDIVEMLAAQAPREGIYVQISGAEELDSFEREKLHSNVDEAARKLGRIYNGIEYFFVHLKKHDTQGKKHKYSVQTRLMTPVGMFHSHAHGYDLAAAADEAMDKLERVVKKDHARTRKEKRQRTERRFKER